ncbi:amino acid adenylation domain-containing protein, partial [Oscillatoria sp. CS-180]|uniref:amino acid adenylation domain-containing protein n=1 Tax=Oscillatoria sp. CS-180 TaxID=3021720 RepID=UPI00232DF4E4
LPHSSTPPLSHSPTPENALYILYTSGSTGRPKGVINTHRGVVNRLCWMQDTYTLTPTDRVLQKTPLSFDVSAWEVFWPLMTGVTLVLARPEGHKDSAYLVNLIQQAQITTLHFVPSMLAAFLEAPDASQCTSLKRVICSGEALPTDLQTRFFQTLPNVELHNLYGPTEAAIDVTAWSCQPAPESSATVPIGHPIANTQIHLLDSQNRRVPPGIPGELHIGGVGVARGYLNRPDLTAEKFVPNPFVGKADGSTNNEQRTTNNEEHILYKTGDRARYLPNGALEFLGRIDHQVKLRGFRIELGEIEAILTQHPDISQCIVVLREDNGQEPQLIAYVVESEVRSQESEDVTNQERRTNNPQPTTIPALKTHLSNHLPAHMVPTQFITLDALPLLPNGKVNRKALPAPNRPKSTPTRSPQTVTELEIAAIWREVLRLEAINAEDNFFELGGNSLSATRVNTRLRKAFELDIPLWVMFERPTIAELAIHIDAMQMTLNQPVSAAVGRKEIEL